jgi:hypothetical protein
VAPLVRDEIANNDIDILPKNFSIREHALDRMSDAAQAFGSFAVFAREITDLRSRNRIARSQLGKDQVLLGMVIHFRVDLEIADDRANDLVIGAVSTIENLKFPLKDSEQLLNIAMLSGQALNDHGSAPHCDTRYYLGPASQLLRQIKSGSE